MPKTAYVAYIDESGDDGVGIGFECRAERVHCS